MDYSLKNIVKSVEAKGYEVDKKPFKLNVVGIRTNNPINQDKFDDKLAYFFYDNNGNIQGKVAIATTDPSTSFLKNPMTRKGAAILKGGQYKDTYILGTHAGKYRALVQRNGPVIVFRDNDRDGYTDFNNVTESGMFGINIHRASRNKNNVAFIGKDSAGCQVFQNEADFNDMMKMAEKSAQLHGNKFTYTLIDERDYIRKRNTWIVIVASVGGGVALAYYLYKKLMK
jgi:hypothetical protein